MLEKGGASIQCNWCPYKKRRRDTETHREGRQPHEVMDTQEECHVKVAAEIRDVHLQASRIAAIARDWDEAWDGISLRRNQPCQHLDFRFLVTTTV